MISKQIKGKMNLPKTFHENAYLVFKGVAIVSHTLIPGPRPKKGEEEKRHPPQVHIGRYMSRC